MKRSIRGKTSNLVDIQTRWLFWVMVFILFLNLSVERLPAEDLVERLLVKLTTPVSLVSEGRIECAPDPENASKLRRAAESGENLLAKTLPNLADEIERGQVIRQIRKLDSKNALSFRGSVFHDHNSEAHNAEVLYFCTKGSGLIVEQGKSLTLSEPSEQIFSTLAVGFPQLVVLAALEHAQNIEVGKSDQGEFYELISASGKMRVSFASRGGVEKIVFRTGEVITRTIKVLEWSEISGKTFPKIVESVKFDNQGGILRKETWTNMKFEYFSGDEDDFVYRFKPGYKIFDVETGASFWSNDVLENGWDWDRTAEKTKP
jgi:hypothetical protein